MAATAEGHERALADRGLRKGLGAYYTPPDVVDGLLQLALDPLLASRVAAAGDRAGAVASIAELRVLDPACGTGNFLVVVVERIAAVLVGLGVEPLEAARVATRCVRGIELDAATARRCRADLRAIHRDGGGRTIVCGDALLGAGPVRRTGFDLVIGNPPFLSQLATTTARSRAEAEGLRSRFGPAVGPYTDPAAVFLLAALHAARADGGVVCLIEPLSLVSARDARGVRAAALTDASLTAMWVAQHLVFDADVEVCAPVLVRGADGTSTRLVRGRSFVDGGLVDAPSPNAASWSSLLAALQDLPERTLETSGVLGDLAEATADFRDQYYGLAGSVVDRPRGGPNHPPLVTSGLIDPARLEWGSRSCRFNKVGYLHPRVDLAGLTPQLQDWAARRLVPKVLVATQTRVIEAIADIGGDLLPSVPVITVTARDGSDPAALWRIAALLNAPATTLVAARRHLGSARNASALRLSASDVLALPLPADDRAWARGARCFEEASGEADPDRRRAKLRASAVAMGAAFGLPADDDLVGWWEARLPHTGRR